MTHPVIWASKAQVQLARIFASRKEARQRFPWTVSLPTSEAFAFPSWRHGIDGSGAPYDHEAEMAENERIYP